jgi:hypothetical protein
MYLTKIHFVSPGKPDYGQFETQSMLFGVERSESQGQAESESTLQQTSEASAVTMETGVPVLLNNEGAIKGNAVINIISKSKVENIIFKSSECLDIID